MNEEQKLPEGRSPSQIVVILWLVGIIVLPALIGWGTTLVLGNILAQSSDAIAVGVLVGIICFIAACVGSGAIMRRNNYFEVATPDFDSDDDLYPDINV